MCWTLFLLDDSQGISLNVVHIDASTSHNKYITRCAATLQYCELIKPLAGLSLCLVLKLEGWCKKGWFPRSQLCRNILNLFRWFCSECSKLGFSINDCSECFFTICPYCMILCKFSLLFQCNMPTFHSTIIFISSVAAQHTGNRYNSVSWTCTNKAFAECQFLQTVFDIVHCIPSECKIQDDFWGGDCKMKI
jgi:hypothetical protein